MIKFKNKNGRFIKLLALFLLFSFALCMIFSFVFLHYHVLANGQIVTHSHIFKISKNYDDSTKSQTTRHSHTKSEFIYLFLTNILNNLLMIAVAFVVILAMTVIFLFPSFERLYVQNFIYYISSRAPPAAVLL